jgi:hypothetical protein
MVAVIAIVVFFVYSNPNGGPDPFGLGPKKEEPKVERSINADNINKEKQNDQ